MSAALRSEINQLRRQLGELKRQIPTPPVRVANGSGGSSRVQNLSSFAIVTVYAPANGGGIGKAVLLTDDMELPDGLIVDPLDPEYDAGEVEDREVEFKSAHTDSDCKVNARVKLSGALIRAGEEWDNAKVWGEHVDGSSYWEGTPDFANNRYLGATGDEAKYRSFQTAGIGITGSAECTEEGIELDVELTGETTFVVPPT